jgi:hypothetical protein
METGKITRAVVKGTQITHHHDTGMNLIGFEIPGWQRVLELAALAFGGDLQRAQEWLGQRFGCTPKSKTVAGPREPSRYDKLIADGYAEIARYEYRDTTGAPRHITIRLQHPDRPGKEFVQGVPDAKAPGGIHWGLKGRDTFLYRLPEIGESSWVLVCEGEKSADRLAARGLPATTAPKGPGKWCDAYTAAQKAKDQEKIEKLNSKLVCRIFFNGFVCRRLVTIYKRCKFCSIRKH